MNPLRYAISRCFRPLPSGRGKARARFQQSHRARLRLGILEDRLVPSTVTMSVSGASAIEGSNTLKFLDHFVSPGAGGLSTARCSTFGPDGNFYVVSASTNAVLRYDPTGEFIDAFVRSGSGGLNNPDDLAFGPDGNLYVSSLDNGEILSYNGSTGAFIGVVANGLSSTGGMGIAFGPDESLYIANQSTSEVLRYNSSTGLSTFIAAGSGGLSTPRNALFGPDGSLYVSSNGTHQILRYDGQTGAFLGVFATTGSTPGPTWMEFGPDGDLYVAVRSASSGTSVSFLRFNATTGTYIDSFALGRDGWSFSFGPNNVIYDSSNSAGGFVDRIGPSSIAAFTVSLTSPSATTTAVSYATSDGTALAGTHYTAVSGTLTFAPGETSKGILVQTLDDGGADPTRYFTANLSNPVGGSITSGQGIGTVLDDTKFYTVDAGSSDSTYQYATGGAPLGTNLLASGDTAPRGVATTAVGTTEWVVDANKTVYVYSTGGPLLGSWSAGGLSSSAKLTGIATDGANIWLVDSNSDKVYEYTGAASRLSGSQSAASSFKLNRSDSNPQDLVTDGTSLWVVDGSALKVFKYTLSGSLLGNWSIDPANTHPTGITINPSNVSDIWIVDNGTDKVYQYMGAASRTSGSQNAVATFALAAGNTNPQGIADPPAQNMPLTPAMTSLPSSLPSARNVSLPMSPEQTTLAGIASLASHDALFAALAQGLPQNDAPLNADSAEPPAGTVGLLGTIQARPELSLASFAPPSATRLAAGLWDLSTVDAEFSAASMVDEAFFAHAAPGLVPSV